jgi:FtsZ-interacting cell division protein ZipA
VSALQIALIIAGVLLVIGVFAFNRWQMRKLRRRDAPVARAPEPRAQSAERVEPTLGTAEAAQGVPAFRADVQSEDAFDVPGDVIPPPASHAIEVEAIPADEFPADPGAALAAARPATPARTGAMPDHEIECLIHLQPAQPVPASALAHGFSARIGKPLRWFGRVDQRSDWERLASDTPGRFAEIIAGLLLADRNGAVTPAQLDNFVRVVGEVASTLPAPFTRPDLTAELSRAESLDRLCAELDVQIGLTVQKPDPGSIAGTRLRGVAEAAGFRLAPGGRFEFVQEETGAVLYTLQNLRPDAFTAESLRLTATNGVVLLLDVARNADPVRVFDQMKLVAKRMAKTLGADLVDDNHRPLDDAAFAKIREQVGAAAEALRAVHIEPGSPRALALFSA